MYVQFNTILFTHPLIHSFNKWTLCTSLLCEHEYTLHEIHGKCTATTVNIIKNFWSPLMFYLVFCKNENFDEINTTLLKELKENRSTPNQIDGEILQKLIVFER